MRRVAGLVLVDLEPGRGRSPEASRIRGEPLSGYAVDLTLRFNKGGAGFLQDHNFPGHTGEGTWPHNDLAELKETLNSELDRLYEEHFGKK